MYHAFVLLATPQQMRMLTSTHVHHWRKWETIVIDQPMPDVPKNTTHPTSDGFESDSDSGNGALAQPFQVQRSCLGTFFFFIIHSLCLENQRKGNKQVFFFFWGKLKGSEGNGRDRSQGFQQWSRRFRASNRPHLCRWWFPLHVISTIKEGKKILIELDAKVCLLL